jgi:hypothetical protein
MKCINEDKNGTMKRWNNATNSERPGVGPRA